MKAIKLRRLCRLALSLPGDVFLQHVFGFLSALVWVCSSASQHNVGSADLLYCFCVMAHCHTSIDFGVLRSDAAGRRQEPRSALLTCSIAPAGLPFCTRTYMKPNKAILALLTDGCARSKQKPHLRYLLRALLLACTIGRQIPCTHLWFCSTTACLQAP